MTFAQRLRARARGDDPAQWLTVPKWAATHGRTGRRAGQVIGRLPSDALHLTPSGYRIRPGTPWPDALPPGRKKRPRASP